MPAFFKPRRRRGPSGPNKNEQKVMRRASGDREARTAGSLKERFPGVESIRLQLTFLTPQQEIYEEGTRTIGPTDTVDFSAPCPGRCGGERGSFDLTKEILTAIEGNRPQSQGRLVCQETMNISTVTPCDFRLEWKSTLHFSDAPKS
jgi:hypothetical protein